MNRASFLGVVLMMCGGSAQGPTPALAPSLARIAAPDVAASTADLPAPPRALPVSASRGSTPPLASAPAEVIFGTPSSADRFAALSSEPLPDSITYDVDAIDYSATIEDGAAVDMSVRYYAPDQVPGGPRTTFNASSFRKLRLQLASVTDAVLTIKLVSSDSVVAEECARRLPCWSTLIRQSSSWIWMPRLSRSPNTVPRVLMSRRSRRRLLRSTSSIHQPRRALTTSGSAWRGSATDSFTRYSQGDDDHEDQ
jgi:hypothetical protein